METQEITYRVDVRDVQAFRRHHRRTSPKVRLVRVVMWTFFGLYGWHSAVTHRTTAVERVVYAALILVIALLVIMGINALVNWIERLRAGSAPESDGLLGEHTITLTSEALYERTPVNDTRMAWSGIIRIDETAAHLFFFIQANAAFFIPRRAFSSDADYQEFLAAARGYFEASRTSPAAV